MATDSHDKMIEAFQQYFKYQDRFEYKGSDEAGIKARYWLSEIRNEASKRRVEIQEKRQARKKARKGVLGRPPKLTKWVQWTYQNQIVEEIPEGYIGFVYLITNLTTGQKYIGKKLAQFKRTKPPLKGKKLKRRSVVESDWRDYWGSSDRLNADVQALGPGNFTREILYLCKSKAEMSYLEAREQFERRVLETDDYYNGIINVRVGGSNILRQRLEEHKKAK